MKMERMVNPGDSIKIQVELKSYREGLLFSMVRQL